MDDQLCVCMGHGLGRPGGDADPGPDVELVLVAVVVDRPSLDVLERQIRTAARRHPGVVEPGDVGMREGREDVTLAQHPSGQGRARPGAVGKLQCNRPPDHAVAALGKPDRSHAAGADLAQQPIRTDVRGTVLSRLVALLARSRAFADRRERIEEAVSLE